MKKITKFCLMILCVGLLAGCGASKLSDKYDEEKLKSSAQVIIKDLNEDKYEDIINMGNEDLKAKLTADKLKEAWQSVNGNLGNYEEISKIAFAEKNGNAIVVAIAKYENNKVQFTISFNENMDMIGIFIK